MAIDNVKRDPAVFNAAAESVGIVWKDRNKDRLQDEGEIQAISADDPRFKAPSTLRSAAVQINLDLPRAMRMGMDLYRQISRARENVDSVATVAAYSVRHPQEGESPEEAVARVHYEYLAVLIDDNRKGTTASKAGDRAQLGYLFERGAFQIARRDGNQPVRINDDIFRVQAAVAELRIKLREIVETEDKRAAADFLMLANVVPVEWDERVVPFLAETNGAGNPHRINLNRLYIIFVNAPKARGQGEIPEGSPPLKDTRETPKDVGCGCTLGARP